MYRTFALFAAALATAACAPRQATVESGGAVAPEVVPANANMIPAGTTLQVRLDQTIGTAQSKVGDQFTATVDRPILSQSGAVVVPTGATVTGRITGLKPSTSSGDQAAIRLDFQQLTFNGQSYPFSARVTTTNVQTQGDTQGQTAKKAGVGAAAGALLGAVLGEGDLGKILIGGALGAAAGTAISLGTGDVDATLPSGTQMTLQSTQVVTLQ